MEPERRELYVAMTRQGVGCWRGFMVATHTRSTRAQGASSRLRPFEVGVTTSRRCTLVPLHAVALTVG